MPKYLIETVSVFRHRYVIETDTQEKAEDAVINHIEIGDLREFSQKHITESIPECKEISDSDYLKMFDQENDFITDWPVSQKLSWINEIK